MIRTTLAVFLGFLISGCATPQRIPAETYRVLVVDRETELPITGAQVRMVFAGVSRSFATTPVVTDARGEATLVVPEQMLPLRFGEGYFAGGYLRQVTSNKEGYETASYTEGPNGFAKQQLVIKQKAVRNRFGSVRFSSSADLDTERVLATFDVLDGPRAGTKLLLPVFRLQADAHFMGRKYYLLRPVSTYEDEYARSPGTAFSLTNEFRSAAHDEPYSP